ncbi:PREDICTED: uncharacterized protein LOC109586035 isoform X1 [Amphimedon queenslandica]|uniref:Death domain-containing protein n=1 Tax=Amphimedon queenslandica TaxID=400682 RepID=A0AAN0JLR6_AMPQE|nr:PREDICTED: uncharacterized protein LOC109586035 isoform X1 [Amphimedon queenslandica]|eukprot:XP_019857760.1 PREDICTED: uncharacterized protein LOC109586035 isoform X1 [Amphimedon queenslandica]
MALLTTPFSSVALVFPNHLTVNDLPEVLQLLRRHRSSNFSSFFGIGGVNCHDLGIHLGLSPTTLNAIILNNKGDTESCLHECLTKWLQNADDVQKTKGGPTISSLISALRKLGENEVADGIDMEKHPACRILARYTSNQSLLSALPQLAMELNEADLIQDMISADYILGKDLMDGEIKEAVCHDYRKLVTFADILCKSKTTAEIGVAIMRDYREIYGSDDENGLKVYLPVIVTSEFMIMRMKLADIVDSIMIKNPRSPSIDDIKHVLSTYNMTLLPQLAQCKNIHDILQLVRDKSSLDDNSMLEYLVNEFNIKEGKPAIEEYKEAFEKLKTKLRQILEGELFKVLSQIKSVTIVVEVVGYSVLKDVQRLSSAVLPRHLKLNVIRDDGSIKKVWKQESSTLTSSTRTSSTQTTEVPAGIAEKDEDQVCCCRRKLKLFKNNWRKKRNFIQKRNNFVNKLQRNMKRE